MTENLQDRIKAAEKMGKTALSSKIAIAKDVIRLTLGGESISEDLLKSSAKGDKSVNEYTKALFAAFESFSSFFSLLSSMRSSWMPIDDDGNSAFGSIKLISDRQGALESYENTFLRMIGMPSSADIPSCRTCLYNLDSDGGLNLASTNLDEGIPRAAVGGGLAGVLNERQNAEEKRVHESKMFDFINSGSAKDANPTIDDESMKPISTAVDHIKKAARGVGNSAEIVLKSYNTNLPIGADITQAFIAFKGFLNSQEKGTSEYLLIINSLKDDKGRAEKLFRELYGAPSKDPANVLNLENKEGFYKYCHLLFPPIHDGEIARCINEPEKIVAEPFLPDSQRIVNKKRIRPTLLEAVIRIRLDNASGTFPSPPLPGAENSVEPSRLSESLGPLEAMIMSRLYDAIPALAKHVDRKREEIRRSQKRTGIKPDESAKPTAEGAKTKQIKVNSDSTSEKYYRSAKMVEDSMMLFLGRGTDSELINLQENTFRKSSISNAHLMGPITSIIGAVGVALDSKMNKNDEETKRVAESGADKAMTEVSSILGAHKGVGIIDAVAFSLALFSVPEGALLGLLNDEQYNNMLSEFPSGHFSIIEKSKMSMIDSVNIITLVINSVYDIFRSNLSVDAQDKAFGVSNAKGPAG
jgi:hypothetical protein